MAVLVFLLFPRVKHTQGHTQTHTTQHTHTNTDFFFFSEKFMWSACKTQLINVQRKQRSSGQNLYHNVFRGTQVGCCTLWRSYNSPWLCTLFRSLHFLSETSHLLYQIIQSMPPMAHLFFSFLENDALSTHQGYTFKNCSVINSSTVMESIEGHRSSFCHCFLFSIHSPN